MHVVLQGRRDVAGQIQGILDLLVCILQGKSLLNLLPGRVRQSFHPVGVGLAGKYELKPHGRSFLEQIGQF